MEIDSSIREVVVVHKSVVCTPSGEIASAPAIIPQGTRTVTLPTQNGGDEDSNDGARLLVILREEAGKSKRQRQSENNVLAIKKSVQEANTVTQTSRAGRGCLAPITQLVKSTKVHPEEIAEKRECSSVASDASNQL